MTRSAHHRAILEQETKLCKTVCFFSFVSQNPLTSPHTQGSKIRVSYIHSAQKEKNCLEAATTSTGSRRDAPPRAPVCRQRQHLRQIVPQDFMRREQRRLDNGAFLSDSKDGGSLFLNMAAEEACDALEKERSDLNLSLRSFDLGSIFQTRARRFQPNLFHREGSEDPTKKNVDADPRAL
jgi:hypothetical protein